MAKRVVKRKDKRTQIARFGCVRSLLIVNGGPSAEVALAPLEMSRLLSAWKEFESAKGKPDERVLAALDLLIPQARTKAPGIVAEVPIASTERVLLKPDFGQ